MQALSFILSVSALVGGAAGTADVKSRTPLLVKARDNVVHIESKWRHFDPQSVEWKHPPASHSSDHRVFQTLAFEVYGTKFKAVLKHNVDLVSPAYQELFWTHSKTGENVVEKAEDDSRLCHYTGFLVDEEGQKIQGTSIAVSNCGNGDVDENGFSGIVWAGEGGTDIYQLQHASSVLSKTELQAHKRWHLQSIQAAEGEGGAGGGGGAPHLHAVVRLQDLAMKGSCGVKEVELQSVGNEEETHTHAHFHADEHESHRIIDLLSIGPSQFFKHGAQPTKRSIETQALLYVEVLIGNDKARYDDFCPNLVSDKACAKTAMLNSLEIMNVVRTLYNDPNKNSTNVFNPPVEIRLSSQVIFLNGDPWEVVGSPAYDPVTMLPTGVSVDSYIAVWHRWRSANGQSYDNVVLPLHDNGHLMSGMDFEDTVVGYAGVGSMCQFVQSGGIDQMGSQLASNAATMAHEIGHNFGMRHDSTSNTCAESGNIMNAVMSSPPIEWSACSRAYYEQTIASRTCLTNVPVLTWGDAVCRDGYVQGAEQCDCGLMDCTSIDKCCDGSTCKLAAGKKCSSADPCCDSNCNIIPASAKKVCRPAATSCDIAEVCDGVRSACPTDKHMGAGRACTFLNILDVESTGACYEGKCMSYTRQEGGSGLGDIYNACPTSFVSIKNTGNTCGTLWCQKQGETTSCTTYLSGNTLSSDSRVQVLDGVPCENGLCYSGICLPATATQLNPWNAWVATSWSACGSCDAPQTRSIKCVELSVTGSESTTLDDYCSPEGRPKSSRLCLNSTLLCVHGENDNSLDLIARDLANKFNAAGSASFMRSLVPRFYGPTTFSYNDPEYWKGIKFLGLFPALGAFACFLALVATRCGVQVCGTKEPNPDGENMDRRKIFFGVLVLMILVIDLFSAWGMFWNGEVRRGLRDPDVGVVPLMSGLINDAMNQLNRFQKPLTFIFNSEPLIIAALPVLESVRDDLTVSQAALSTTLGTLEASLNVLAANSTIIPGYNSAAALVLTCVGCTAVQTSLTTVTDSLGATLYQVSQEAVSTSDQAISYLGQLKSQLVLGYVAPYGSLAQIEPRVQGTFDTMQRQQLTIEEYNTNIEFVDKIRWPVVLTLFFLPFLSSVLLVVGYCTNKSCPLSWSLTFFWFVLIFFWALLAFHIPLAITFADLCEWLDKVEVNVAQFMNFDEQQNAAFTGCLAGTSLVSALNLTDEISLMKTSLTLNTSFTDTTGLLISTSKSSFITFNRSVYDLTSELLGINSTLITFDLSSLPGGPYSRTVASVQGCTDAGACNVVSNQQLRDSLVVRIRAEVYANQVLAELRANATAAVSQADSLGLTLQTAVVSYAQASADLKPFEEAADNLFLHATCSSLSDTYQTFKDTLCDLLLVAFSTLAFTFFIIGIVALPTMHCVVRQIRFATDKRRGKKSKKQKDRAALRMEKPKSVKSSERHNGHKSNRRRISLSDDDEDG